MIGPVGVQNTDLGDGGIALLFVAEILLTEGNVIRVHGKAVAADKVLQSGTVQRAEAVQNGDFGGNLIPDLKGFRFFQRGFARFHRVDDILFNLRKLGIRKGAVERVHSGGADERALPLGENLDALGRGVRALVKLSGEVFHGKNSGVAEIRLLAHKIELGL